MPINRHIDVPMFATAMRLSENYLNLLTCDLQIGVIRNLLKFQPGVE